MNNNIRAEIVKINGKDGKTYEGVKFFVMTAQGEFESRITFPTRLELELVRKAVSPVKEIYSNEL